MLDRLRHQGIVLPSDEELNKTIAAFEAEGQAAEMLKRQRLLAEKDGG